MGKITLSFASPEKENYLFYIYEVITWEKIYKRSAIHYSCIYSTLFLIEALSS